MSNLKLRDVFKDPLTADEIRALAIGRSVADLFAMKSPSVAKLGINPAVMGEAEMIEWMIKEPRLLKRPILVVDGVVHIQPRPKDVEGIQVE